MTSPVTISPDALDGCLDSGDALINFSFGSISASVPYVVFGEDGTASLHSGTAKPVGANVSVDSLNTLLGDEIQRFAVVSDGGSAAVEFAAKLEGAGVAHSLLLLAEDCTADAFMDEEDSEAVAERLRQLGYI